MKGNMDNTIGFAYLAEGRAFLSVTYNTRRAF